MPKNYRLAHFPKDRLTYSLKHIILIGLCALLVQGCAAVRLNENGKKVQLLTAFPASENPSDFDELGTISCSKGTNARSAAANIIQCRNELRNNAGALGAELVILENQQLGQPGSFLTPNGCANCITFVGTAYKKKRSIEITMKEGTFGLFRQYFNNRR